MSHYNNNNLPAHLSIPCEESVPTAEPVKDGAESPDQIKLELVKLFVDCVRVGTDVYKGREKINGDWEAVHQKIAVMDKEMDDALQKMEHEMAKIKNATDRLHYILDAWNQMDDKKSALMADAIGKAIVQLTAKG